MRAAVLAILLTLGLVPLVSSAGSHVVLAPSQSLSAPGLEAQAQTPNPTKDVNVDINLNRQGGGRWYASPVWIAIGGLAVLVVLVLLVMAMRGGGGTTIVRE